MVKCSPLASTLFFCFGEGVFGQVPYPFFIGFVVCLSLLFLSISLFNFLMWRCLVMENSCLYMYFKCAFYFLFHVVVQRAMFFETVRFFFYLHVDFVYFVGCCSNPFYDKRLFALLMMFSAFYGFLC